jgi:hypothetical protein
MELVAIGGLPAVARTLDGAEGAVTPPQNVAPAASDRLPPGLHAPAEPSLPPPWALSNAAAVAELLTPDAVVFAAAHAAYRSVGDEGAGGGVRELAL